MQRFVPYPRLTPGSQLSRVAASLQRSSDNLMPCPGYTPRPDVEFHIRAAIESRFGVQVLWGPPSVGKSTITQKVALDLKGTRPLLYTLGSNQIAPFGAYSWLKSLLDIDRHEGSISTVLARPLTRPPCLILDQMDYFLPSLGDHEAEKFIVSLAEESVNLKRFNVLLILTCPRLARIVLNWDDDRLRIREVMRPAELRWNRAALTQFFEHRLPHLCVAAEKDRPITAQEFANALHAGSLEVAAAGAKADQRVIARHAQQAQRAWKNYR